jgi:hypothetical protein
MLIPDLPQFRPLKRFLNAWTLRAQKVSLDIEICATNGFFAQLNWCLYVLAYCDKRKLLPRIRLTGPGYSNRPEHDWFHDFFVETDKFASAAEDSSQRLRKSLRITHIEETSFAQAFGPSMTIEEGHRLFSTVYRVNDMIESYVDRFIESEFGSDGSVIGLHFRGTDKWNEAERVDWCRCFRSVVKLAADHPETRKVFVSSDDPAFVEWFGREARGTLSVIVHPDEERSRNGQPVHTNSAGDHNRKGFEALVNCLLLSRCCALIRTASFLSGWSSVFNPKLSFTLLNEPRANTCWFPDRELVRRSETRYR